jgi:nitrogen fixation protein NifU and related proteins
MITEDQEIYKENIIDHYKHPHNKKKLEDCSIEHKELNPLCGDEITIYLDIKENKVEKIGWTGNGCAISQASISLLTDELKNKTIKEIKQLTEQDILDLLGIPISFVRKKCALLSLKVVLKGIENE